MMENGSALLAMLLALGIGAVSPGPSFMMVARSATREGRRHASWVALGMGLGAMLFALAALLGLQAVLKAVPAVYLGFKLLGGAYLLYLGWQIWRGARAPLVLADEAAPSPAMPREGRAFALGMLTQLSNPKTAVVYTSVFAALMPAAPGLGFLATLVLLVGCIEAGWYLVVARALSAPAARSAYLRSKGWVDRVAGGLMGCLGVRLLETATEP
jgi:threonine/homoserine/homoserine lactone efflux protein